MVKEHQNDVNDVNVFIVNFEQVNVSWEEPVKGVLCKGYRSTGDTGVLESLFNKVATLQPANLLRQKLRHSCCPVSFVKFFRAASLLL